MAVSKGFSKFANIVTIVLIILIGLMIVIYIADVILSKNNKDFLNRFDPIRNFTIKKRDMDRIQRFASSPSSLALLSTSVSNNPDVKLNEVKKDASDAAGTNNFLRMRGGCGCNKYFGGCGDAGSQIDSLTFQPEKFLM